MCFFSDMGKQTTQSTLIQPDVPNPGFSPSAASTSGACQIVLGVMCIIFQISATAIGASMGDVAAGIWAGVFVSILKQEKLVIYNPLTHLPGVLMPLLFISSL